MNTYNHNSEFEQVLLGSLMGDAGIYKSKPRNVRPRGTNAHYQECHSVKQKEYLLWKRTIYGQKLVTYMDNTTFYVEERTHRGVRLRVQSHPYFNSHHASFYTSKGKKQITEEQLNKLNWLGIAVWFIDDGYYNYRSNCISFACHPSHQEAIATYFTRKGFDLLISDKYHIHFNRESSIRFVEQIKPFVLKMPKCVHYKIGIDEKRASIARKKHLSYKKQRYALHRESEIAKRLKLYYTNHEENKRKNKITARIKRLERRLSNSQ